MSLAIEPMAVESYESLGDLLYDALVQWKSETALIEASRKREARRLTYLEAMREARRLTGFLASRGVGAGDRVAVLLPNQPAWLLAATAVFWRGGVLVPLDYKLTAPEQAELLAHAKPKLLFIDYGLYRAFAEAPKNAVVLDAPDGAELHGNVRFEELGEAEHVERVARRRADQATLVYSSGTGGTPKGCVLSHGAYLSQLEGLLERFPMAPGDRYFSILPTNHAIDFMVGFVGPFVCGATVVHQRTLRPTMLRWTMQRYGITHMAVVPMILAAFETQVREKLDELSGWKRRAANALMAANEKLTDRVPNHGLSARLLAPIHEGFGGKLRMMFCGGAYTDRTAAEFFYKLGIPVVIGYGLTEACTVVTVNGMEPFRADSVGSMVRHVQVRIHEPDAAGVGEVCVAGPTLMDGYVGAPELTAETIRDGWLHTGDLGWLDASEHLHLVGRIKDVIVTAGGKNVYPEDVEHAFANVPCEELAVVAKNSIWRSRAMVDEELVLVIRTDSPDLATAEALQANRKLADYRRVSSILLVTDDFPRTASMKLKRRALAESLGEHWQPGNCSTV